MHSCKYDARPGFQFLPRCISASQIRHRGLTPRAQLVVLWGQTPLRRGSNPGGGSADTRPRRRSGRGDPAAALEHARVLLTTTRSPARRWFGQRRHRAVDHRPQLAVEVQQARGGSFGRWILGDQLRRQLEIEVADAHLHTNAPRLNRPRAASSGFHRSPSVATRFGHVLHREILDADAAFDFLPAHRRRHRRAQAAAAPR